MHKSLPFRLLHLELDPDGRYVVIHAMVACLGLVLVGLYIPPPASIKLHQKLISLVANFSTDNVIVMGDFNMAPDPEMDRFTSSEGEGGWISSDL